MRVIIIGGDRTVYFLARQFVRQDHHVVIINRDAPTSRELAERTKATVVLGDGTDVTRLEEAGARQADVLLALTPHDEDNLVACQIAQRMFGIPRTIAQVNDPDNEPVFQKLGISATVSSARIIGSIIEQETSFEDVTGFVSLARGKVNVSEVHLHAGAPAIGQTLQQLELEGGSLIACIIRNEAVIIPRGSTVLQQDDHLVLISQPEHQQADLETLCG